MNNLKWEWGISTPKQENGLWGMPLQCKKLDKIPMDLTKENEIKHSALCIGIAEAYPNETFEIFWSTRESFFIKLSKSGIKKISYKDYDLINNVLIYK